jgi:hypothetical protein
MLALINANAKTTPLVFDSEFGFKSEFELGFKFGA